MSQKFHITIHPGCPSGPENHAGAVALGPFDPGGDDSIGKVDDPGGDDSIGPVDDPGGDDSIGKVDDPNGLARALVLAAQAYGSGGAAPGSVVVNQGGGCCCAHKNQDSMGGAADSSNLEYSGFVVFRLRASAPLKKAPPVPDSLEEALRRLLTDPPPEPPLPPASPPRFPPVLPPPSPSLSELLTPLLEGILHQERFFHLEQIAAKTRLPPLHSLLSYHRLDLRDRPELIESALSLLDERPEVDLAYRELAASDPAMTLEGRSADQGYLEEAPHGIGAREVWAHLTPGGSVPTVIDLEQGWNPEHENLSPDHAQLEPWVGSNKAAKNPADGHHGTAVLGQLVASQDGTDQGVLGLLPAARLELASHYLEDPQDSQAPPPSNGHVARAIAGSLAALVDAQDLEPRGTILILEVQRSYLPTEVDPADFDAIRLATALGVTVVEAAGNGGRNLDRYEGVEGGLVLNRKSPRFRDSGAILVGAADPLLPHDRLEFSNFGSRVDCFAAGRAVTTLGFGDLSGHQSDQRDFYTNTFDGTSSASPIIAGAAALTQTLYIDRTGNYLPPLRLRKLLKDPETGTPQGPGKSGFIGIMPDLSAMLEKTLRILPEIYFRKVVGNGPKTPPSGDLTSCPDLLLTQNPKDLASSFGASVIGQENSMVTGAHSPGPSQVVTRLKNSGASKGSREVHIFSAPAATFLSPDQWSLEGTTNELEVPTGNTPVLSSPVNVVSPLDAEGVPTAFLAIARVPPTSPELPPGGKYFRWPLYREFLRERSVGCRNVYLIETDPSPGSLELPFFLSGFPNSAARYDLEVHSQIPEGVPFQLVVPDDLAFKLYQNSTWLGLLQGGGPMPPYEPCSCFRNIYLPRGEHRRIELKIINKKNLRTGHSIFIRQLYRGEEIGRITWYFRAPIDL